jgi:hypothetical protein
MNTTNRWWRLEIILLLIVIVLLIFVLGVVCRHHHGGHPPPTSSRRDTIPWTSWNILFKQGTTAAERVVKTTELKNSIEKYLADNGLDTSRSHVGFLAHFCPCDSNLQNLDIQIINESGNPVTPPPPTGYQPPPQGLGGSVYVSAANIPVDIPEKNNDSALFAQTSLNDSFMVGYSSTPQSPSDPVLAVIDTGLDSTEFFPAFRASGVSSLVWKDPSLKPTLYNTLIGSDPGRLTDDETGFKHGTSVTYIALSAAFPQYPRIMVLKALDAKGSGSIFTVSCAMSYALQHKVSAINASLGYQGLVDPILQSYFAQGNAMKIPMVVAVGNDPTKNHDQKLVCSDTINHTDSLAPPDLFYPAAFSSTMHYVISVTGVNRDTLPCHFQKFSNKEVYTGVLVDHPGGSCCSYFIPYLNRGSFVEGSSFVTPVISAKLMIGKAAVGTNVNGVPLPFDPRVYMNSFPKSRKLAPYIESGRYTTWSY